MNPLDYMLIGIGVFFMIPVYFHLKGDKGDKGDKGKNGD